MVRNRFAFIDCSLLALSLALSACNMPMAAPSGAPGVTPPGPSTSTGGMQVRITNVAEGGSIQATMVSSETSGMDKPLVIIRVEVIGGTAMNVTLTANGMPALDESDHLSEAVNSAGASPFPADVHWSPLNGAGEYTLVVSALDFNKQTATGTVHVTVTGIPVFTPTPPPPGREAAARRISEIIRQQYGVEIPLPSLQRFDFSLMPGRSRWIGAAYYQGHRYYVELFDDTHYELSPAEYAAPARLGTETWFVLCKPAGLYRILVVYVDYGNLPVDKADALAQVPILVNWIDRLYDDFARSQGFSSSPLHIQADAVWISPPPSPGQLLTSSQILAATGTDPSLYDFIIEIDLDQDNTVGNSHWKGILGQGGGIALQGCGLPEEGDVNIFSAVHSPQDTQYELHGNLSMDFNHELSHLFGMMDSWPFNPSAITSPDGQTHDDWIPYVTFGWTDADGDGVPEIIDPTPYGTLGPQP